MTSLITEYNQIIGKAHPPYATEEELTEMGHLLDKMEVTEAYMHSSSCTTEEYKESEVALKTLCDRLDMLMEYV